MARDIVFVGFQGGSCSTLSHPVEIFSHAPSHEGCGESDEPAFRMHIATTDDAPLDRIGFFQVEPTIRKEDYKAPDVVFLTATSLDVEASVEENKALTPWLRQAHRGGSIIAAVCPSQSLLAAAGLLDGKTSAVHWSLLNAFREKWPGIDWRADDMVVEEDRVVTCCGGSAATDMSLYLVSRLMGEEAAINCARWFLADMPRMRQAAPAPVFEAPAVKDAQMQRIQDWLHAHYAEDVTLSALARQFGMTERTFYRQFQKHFGETPRVYLQMLRLAAARKLLETDRFPIEEIARKVGYDDALFFRKLFKRHLNMSPSDYREQLAARNGKKSRAERESSVM